MPNTSPAQVTAIIALITACSVINVVFAFGLLYWRRWAFYGFAAITILGFAINLLMGTWLAGLLGLSGILILFLVLQLGGPDKAWYRLK